MLLFLLGMAILVIGYFTYGRFVEKILGPDDRPTPCRTCSDGVDFVRLPHWKNMLIQLLNIAGVGPVIGVILGIKFGAIAFLIIPVGNIIGGAVHDFVGGMMSLRHNGANLPELIRMNTGKAFYWIFSAFMIFLLLLVVAVFINIPARLIDGFWPSTALFWTAVIAIFLYYIAATLFPVDKIIGSVYPLFGALLILGTFAIFAVLMFHAAGNPALLSESEAFRANMLTPANNSPILPMLFVTIACGAVSGFHSLVSSGTSSKTISNEKDMPMVGYGAMVVESLLGIVSLVVVGAVAVNGTKPDGTPFAIFSSGVAGFLEKFGLPVQVATVFMTMCVSALALTSLDSVARIGRMSFQELFYGDTTDPAKMSPLQRVLTNKYFATVITLFFGYLLTLGGYNNVWPLFGSANQLLAALVLIALAVFLKTTGRTGWTLYIPMFAMLAVTFTALIQKTIALVKNIAGGQATFLVDGLQFIVAVLLMVLGVLVAFSCLKKLFGKSRAGQAA